MEHNAGEIIELAVRRQKANISELSKRLKVNRRTIYNWFRQKRLHVDVILAIGKAINYDFSQDFECMPDGFGTKENKTNNTRAAQSNATKNVYYWMEKYIALLEERKNLVRKIESHQMLS